MVVLEIRFKFESDLSGSFLISKSSFTLSAFIHFISQLIIYSVNAFKRIFRETHD